MTTQAIYEIIGYIASLLIAASLMMRSILKLRVINLIGAIFFTAYGLLIHTYPVAAVNGFIVIIDIYYLVQMLAPREFFRLLEVQPGSEYLGEFITFYAEDIQRFQPGFSFTPQPNQLIFFVLRNMVPAGLIIGEKTGPEDFVVRLDYAIPGYRDLKIGRFVYQQHAADLRKRGIARVFAEPGAPAHARYLEQMGFAPQSDASGQPLYRLNLS